MSVHFYWLENCLIVFHWNEGSGIIVLTSYVSNVKEKFCIFPFIIRRGKSSQHRLLLTCARVVMSCKFESSNSLLKSYEYWFTKNTTSNFLCMYFSYNLSSLIWFDNFDLLMAVTPVFLFVFQHKRLLPLSMLAGHCECVKKGKLISLWRSNFIVRRGCI